MFQKSVFVFLHFHSVDHGFEFTDNWGLPASVKIDFFIQNTENKAFNLFKIGSFKAILEMPWKNTLKLRKREPSNNQLYIFRYWEKLK